MNVEDIKEIRQLEAEINAGDFTAKDPLLKQTFLVWYLLVEGSTISEGYLQELLNRNIKLVNEFYSKNPTFIFLKGWMIGISPWYFDKDEIDNGDKYLNLASKLNPENLLFKWAAINSRDSSESELRNNVLKNLRAYYIDYEPIQNYFQNILVRNL